MSEIKYLKDENKEYKFKLSQFEGPLDLLLHLIKDAKLDIKDVVLAEITEQYLAYLNDIDEIDVDRASDFIDMAATLIEIKSKKILPIQQELPLDEESEEQKLVRRLEEYKLFKEASEQLKPLEDLDRFYKKPDNCGDFRCVLTDINLDGMLDAFAHLMHKIGQKSEEIKPKRIEKDRFTVAQKMGQIKDIILTKKQFKFSELFDDDYSKSEAINTFLAVLELLKLGVIYAKQQSNFEDIEIVKKEQED